MRRTRREGAFAIGLKPAIISRAGAARRVEHGLQFSGLQYRSSHPSSRVSIVTAIHQELDHEWWLQLTLTFLSLADILIW